MIVYWIIMRKVNDFLRNLQHSVCRYCYGVIKDFLLKKNFSNRTFVSKENTTFVREKQGAVWKVTRFILISP
ncbi:hypothetical protein DXB65_09510 [Bacteroides oleiciplenus]|uniref:Uncharacterized protein n=1 Tax=Bacteroides oleiciplenus TaxID=626931 RepID=A0A3E5BG92_9BACE|nr:hypothetical protein DXB65_09510 [Bacteroides oleiciplenus]